ncbi:pirin family protein [Motiliproteus coralliicola]|uniref:Pirin family protein n=1 Tax=Motiliproteus coralliicola TaxID=2283196 RepID=A0A369WMX4_9GAMM|nr:pirin family protein [Motiliproteus coralliicola]RDE22851.1 pirin family protein [Motiliproteus coralliicola]
MLTLRPSLERGHANHGWLDSRHSFSFAEYYDPAHMGVSSLRVINEDWIDPGAGFEPHPHRDMEIITYVMQGQIEHRDTMGSHSVLRAGEVQAMSAGSGILHSEFNPSDTKQLHLLQIWIQPNQRGVTPRYDQKDFSDSQGITLLVSPDGRDGSLPIHQQASLYQIKLDNETAQFNAEPDRTYYLQLARGTLAVNNVPMEAGDGATLSGETQLSLTADQQAEALLFELP